MKKAQEIKSDPIQLPWERKTIDTKGSRSFIGLFSGCGGLDLGAMYAGFHPVWAADSDAKAVETYKTNLDSSIECADLTKILAPRSLRDVDLIVGGPPCQGFSSAGSKDRNDSRNKLWKSYLETLETLQPKAFLLENVPNFAREFPHFLAAMKSSTRQNYTIDAKRLVAQYYGVPQFRDRMFVIGVRRDITQNIVWPEPDEPEIYNYTHRGQALTTMQDALQDLGPPIGDVRATCSISDHVYVPLNEQDATIALHIPSGGSLKDIPDKHLPSPYKGRVRMDKGWTWFYRKPRTYLPGRTVLASIRPNYATILAPDVEYLNQNGKWRWVPVETDVHTAPDGLYTSPVNPRRLTIRECARLQTFPDWFRFSGEPLEQHRQIGNAVPVELGRRLSLAIMDMLEGRAKEPAQKLLFASISN